MGKLTEEKLKEQSELEHELICAINKWFERHDTLTEEQLLCIKEVVDDVWSGSNKLKQYKKK